MAGERRGKDDRKQFTGPVAHKVFVRSPKAYWTYFPKAFEGVREFPKMGAGRSLKATVFERSLSFMK
jgi:hypothetical protein